MLRRSVLQLSSRRSVAKMPVQITRQMPSYLLSRKAFSATSQQPEFQGPGSTEKQSDSGSPLLKIFGGALLLGSVSFAAYHYGLIGNNYVREQHNASEPVSVGIGNKNLNEFPNSSQSSQDSKHLGVSDSEPMFQESKTSTPNLEHSEETIGTHADLTKVEDLNKGERKSKFQGKDTSGLAQHDIKHIEEKDLLSSSQTNVTSDGASSTSSQSPEENHNMKNPEVKPNVVQHEAVEITPASMQDNPDSTENETKSTPMQHIATQDMPKDVQGDATGQMSSLLDEYYLRDIDQGTTTASSKKSKDLDEAIKDLNDGYISKDGKLVLDFLEAIHEAEKRQAGLDARTFAEEKKMMKEKYEKELKDARVRELMYAEREAILEKELNREKAKAAAALKSLQEKLEEKHKMELEEKENAAELKLEKKEELAKAELAAAIASEKASQIEKMAEANLHINALCMAFYARSEEARQSHSVHKLALGALALEDALSKGLPIQKEIDALHTYLEGIDKDSLLDLVLSSLPEEPRRHGTDTILQLNEKFDALKQTLRHFSLIPPGGGGILAHSLAHVASRLKVKEVDQSGDGIESLINRVESLLAQGKLSEAADTLEDGVKGSQAAEIVGDWVKRARYRAIAEQALTLLQSYATSISLT